MANDSDTAKCDGNGLLNTHVGFAIQACKRTKKHYKAQQNTNRRN